jgi:hypothetical protein
MTIFYKNQVKEKVMKIELRNFFNMHKEAIFLVTCNPSMNEL